MNVVEASNLTHRYGRVTALRDVNLTIPEGVVYASAYLARRYAWPGQVVPPGLNWPAVRPGPQDAQHAAYVGLVHPTKGAEELQHVIEALPQWRWGSSQHPYGA